MSSWEDGSLLEASTMNPITKGKITLDVWRAKWTTRSAIETRQQRRLADMLSYVRRQSRFYKQHYTDVPEGCTDLTQFPPVTKPMLMEHFDDVVTDTAITKAEIDTFVADESKIGHRFLDRYPVWTTSGTTGEPGIFVQDDTSLALLGVLPDRWVLDALLDIDTLRRLVKYNFRQAVIAITGGHFLGASAFALLQRESTFLENRIRLFSPTQPLDDLIKTLNRYQPALLMGYATVIVELARAQRDGYLDINPAFVSPASEPVSATQKRDIERAFDCEVREAYAATEFDPIAIECGHGNLHANADWVVVEPVDDNYQPVEPGEPSETVLITNLANRIQPLIRYDLGDSITMYDEHCPCGSAFPIIEVEGRQGDVFHFETTDGRDRPVFPLALSSVVEEVPGVRRTQLIRTAPSTLRVRLEVASGHDEANVWEQVRTDLKTFLEDQRITDITLEKATESPQRNPRSGKFRHVWSEQI
ncbi:Phenylacetate-coenzyme A ligase PaaK, adenylate-forming domain family [Haladaptatus litoreus]|uniref:Phenylacetate-coenzyme A ligase PaaK, adenylate-forming domain family n=1 Tax=Haladaptatus litoreus TaxID=553468 RepID=A0A1N7CUT0_9EURY|nr:phenylacetate--CoA ligase family protein [Haladaptatus litoreus]SIR67224.1 Phenylacetate-coenzyme A ligase PaaK, adenylate-forming domain family [Haladaptatus litoreus]